MDCHDQPPIIDIDLHSLLLPTAPKVLMVQPSWIPKHSNRPHIGLPFVHDNAVNRAIEQAITIAYEAKCSAIVFPELAIPESSIGLIGSLISDKDIIFIGGSHYATSAQGVINVCPVFFRSHVYLTHKLRPAPIELSAIAGEGVAAGQTILRFSNTPIGNFSVLICADYLHSDLKASVIDDKTDMLFVVSLQSNSDRYYHRIDIDVESSDRGVYAFYSNSSILNASDGRSAVFAVVDDIYKADLRRTEMISGDAASRSLVAVIDANSNYLIASVDLRHKRPTIPRTALTKPNVEIITRSHHPAFAIDVDAAMALPSTTNVLPTLVALNQSSSREARRLPDHMSGVLTLLAEAGDIDFFDNLSAQFGEILWQRGDYRGLQSIGEVVESIALRYGNIKRRAEALIDYLGWMMAAMGEISKGKSNILRGLAIAQQVGEVGVASRALRHLAAIELINGNSRFSFQYLSRAYREAKLIRSEAERFLHFAPLYYGFAEFFLRTKRPIAGRRAHAVARHFYDKIGDPSKAIKLSVQAALILETESRHDEALTQYGRALRHAGLSMRPDDTIRSLEGISRCYFQLNDPGKANRYRLEAAEWRRKTPILVS